MNTYSNSNVVPFIAKGEGQNEDTIIINHGMHTLEAVKAISDYLKELPLNAEQHNTLISLMENQLLIAEHEAFMQGFVSCMDEIQGCGLNVAMDKRVNVTDIEI